jgi:ribose transport system substrate-binding protein
MKIQKQFAILSILIIAVFVLAGCAPAATQAPAAPAAPAATEPAAAAPAATEPAAAAPAGACEKMHTLVFIPGALANPSQAYGWKQYQELGPKSCFNVSVMDGGGDVQVQAKAVADAVAQKPDVIMVNPNDATAIIPSLQAAKDAGVVVGLFMVANAPGSDSSINFFVTMDDITGGKLAATTIASAFPNGATGVEIGGQAGHIAAINRHQGFSDGVAGTNLKVLDYKNPQQWDAAQAQSIMEDFITKYGDKIKFVFVHWDGGATGVINALTAAKMTDVMIVAVDGNKTAFQNVESWPGTYVSIGQSVPKITQLTLDDANKFLAKDPTARLDVFVPLDVIDKNTIKNFPVPEW